MNFFREKLKKEFYIFSFVTDFIGMVISIIIIPLTIHPFLKVFYICYFILFYIFRKSNYFLKKEKMKFSIEKFVEFDFNSCTLTVIEWFLKKNKVK